MNHTGQRRNTYFAIRKRIQGINRQIRTNPRSQLHLDFHIPCRIVNHLLDLDLPVITRFDDTLNERPRSGSERNFLNQQSRFILLLNFGTNPNPRTLPTLVVHRKIGVPTGWKIGQHIHFPTPQNINTRLTQLYKIMGHNFSTQTHRNTINALRQQQWEFHWQRNRLTLPTIVTQLPIGGLFIKRNLFCKRTQPRLNIPWCRSPIASSNIAPVTLGVDQQLFLTQIHQRIANRSIAVWVIRHRRPNNVRHLVVTTVVHLVHRMQNPALHGLQTILQSRNGTLQDYITGIFNKPILVHPAHGTHLTQITRNASTRDFLLW